MASNSVVSIGVTINSKQAEQTIKALDNQINVLTKDLQKMQEKLLDKSKWEPTETEDTINRDIKRLEKDIKSYKNLRKNTTQAIKGVDEVLGNISKANYNELTRTRGLLQSAVKSLDPTTKQYKQKVLELQTLNEEIARRSAEVKGGMGFDKAQQVLAKPGSFSADKIKEAVGVMTQFRDATAKSSNEWTHWNGYVRNGEKRLEELKKKAKLAENGLETMESTLAKANNINAFKGTREDLEKLKQRLEEIKAKELKLNTKDSQKNVKAIDDALFKVQGKLQNTGKEARSMSAILGNIKGASLSELERTASRLEEEIRGCGSRTEEFVKKSAKLRQVNSQIDKVKNNFKEKESVIARTAKRLASYVAVYTGFNAIVAQIRKVITANLELSDSFADIQKTTGMSAKQVGELSNKINDIDTRTAQKELHDLAYEAGKLGISAEEDVLAFVKAGNQLVVALGEDLGGAEAVRQLMKVNAILGETEKLGIERALLATGSAINEISQTSRASAGPIADVVSRIGAIGAAARLQMSDLIALAGTADAMGQSAEVAGTAFNKFITQLQTNTVDVAYALGLDPQNLRALMDSGNTMQAIIQIFERLNEMGDLSSFGGIFKDLGSEGARMTQVLATMAAGVDELKAQVFTSTKAFREATSVTNEYNIKNESAAAIAKRMGNNIREAFTNSGAVEWLKEFLQWLYYLPQRIENSKVALFALRAVMWEIAMLSGVRLMKIIGTGLVSALTTMSGRVNMATVAWKALYLETAKDQLKKMAAGAVTLTGGVNRLKVAFLTLGKVLLKNPIFLIATVLTSVALAFQAFRKEVDKATAASADMETAIQNEQYSLRKLMTDINKANSATGERASLIKQLNDKYGNYLGFLVTESNYVDQLAYIYDLLNAKIRETISLKMQEKMLEDIATTYAPNKNTANKNILEGLYSMPGVGEIKAPEYMQKIVQLIGEEVEKGGQDLNSILEKVFGEAIMSYQEEKKKLDADYTARIITYNQYTAKLKTARNQKLGEDYDDLVAGIKKLLQVETSISEETKKAQTIIDANTKYAEKQSADITREHLQQSYSGLTGEETTDQLKTLKQQTESYIKMQQNGLADLIQKKNALKGLTFEEQTEYEELVKVMNSGEKPLDEQIKRYDYLNTKKTVGLKLSDEEEKKLADTNAEIQRMEENLTGVNEKLAKTGFINAWGSSEDLEKMSGKQLSALYHKLEDDAALLAADASEGIQTQFWKNFSTRDKAVEWYKNQSKAIAEQLRKLGMDTNANWLKGPGGSGDKKTAKQQYDGWLQALEAYYNERETIIRRNGMKENKLETEINRELEALNAEKLAAQRELEEGLLQDLYQGSAFDPKKYEGVITGTEYFANLTLENMRAIVATGGPKLDAVIRKNMTDRMVKLEEQAYKIKQRIEKILLEDDFTEQVAQQYLASLDELGLLFNIKTEAQSERTEEEGERRLAYMREWAKESYSITATELEGKMKANALFDDWIKGRTHEDYEALLIQLRKFHDDQEEAARKSAERRKRIFDNSQKGIKLQNEAKNTENKAKAMVGEEENDVKMWERFRDLGLVSDSFIDKQQIEVHKAEIDLYQAKIDASQKYIEQMLKETNAEKDKVQSTIDNLHRELQNQNLTAEQRAKINADIIAAEQKKSSLIQESDIMAQSKREEIANAQKKLEAAQQSMTDRYIAMEQRKVEEMKKYADIMVQYSYDLGYAITNEEATVADAGKAMIKSLLTTLKDWAQIKLTEIAMQKIFAEESVATTGMQVGAELGVTAAKTEADIAAGTASATAKETGSKGLIGLAVGAVIGAALSALLGMALGKLDNAKKEVSSISGVSSSGRLATGMLTYAEGNYPVLGNDGQVYNAKYEGAGMKTGVYRGGAHFGIFSEKKPEAIIDGDTTQRLIMNHPDIWKAIVTLSKNGRLPNGYGVRTFATGNINELAASGVPAVQEMAENTEVTQMRAALENNNAVIAQFSHIMEKIAAGGIQANINMYGEKGMYKSMKKADKFASRSGMK